VSYSARLIADYHRIHIFDDGSATSLGDAWLTETASATNLAVEADAIGAPTFTVTDPAGAGREEPLAGAGVGDDGIGDGGAIVTAGWADADAAGVPPPGPVPSAQATRPPPASPGRMR
jgi:hypothetical protein